LDLWGWLRSMLVGSRFSIGKLAGTGTPAGTIPRSGTGMGRKSSPWVLAGTGAGNLPPRGDGDGRPFPDGEFPVAIPSGMASIWWLGSGSRRWGDVGLCHESWPLCGSKEIQLLSCSLV
jgi:hypothetical protein